MTDGFSLIKEDISNITGAQNVFENEPMKKHTSFRVGGPARLLVTPEAAEQLIALLKLLKHRDIDYYVMGNGTNLIVRDNGFKGVIIKICDKMSNTMVSGSKITAEAGALLSAVSRLALNNSLTGLEFAEGIPGTVGGAAAMNAGAYGGEMKNVIIRADALGADGEIVPLGKDELELGYRSSIFSKRGLICLSAVLLLDNGDTTQIREKMAANKRLRIEKQPLDIPSAGSTFKRPEGYFAGKLISDCGLKGCKIGGAAVSDKHGGFIVNAGRATAADILNLIAFVQKTVSERFGVTLQPEVKIIGD